MCVTLSSSSPGTRRKTYCEPETSPPARRVINKKGKAKTMLADSGHRKEVGTSTQGFFVLSLRALSVPSNSRRQLCIMSPF